VRTVPLVGLLILASCLPKKDTENLIVSKELGFKVFTYYCQRCHGPDASGTPFAPFKLFERPSTTDKESFYKVLNDGIDGTQMRSFKSRLVDKEMESLYLYLESLRGEGDERARNGNSNGHKESN
jgi:mono/diheme cytochrome c family protein